MGLLIRPYEESDWRGIEAAHDAARKMELHYAGLDDAFIPLVTAAQQEDLFDYHIDVAVLDGDVAGFAAYTAEELAWLYVAPSLHRQGVGTALVRHALSCQPGIRSVEVLSGNAPARKLYEGCGFTLADTQHGKMPGNESFPVTVWCMERK